MGTFVPPVWFQTFNKVDCDVKNSFPIFQEKSFVNKVSLPFGHFHVLCYATEEKTEEYCQQKFMTLLGCFPAFCDVTS